MTSAMMMAGFAAVSPHTAAAATGMIGGTVYRDLDNDGVRDPREPGVGGVVIDAGDISAVTDSQGRWSLRPVGTVQLQVSTGWYRSQCNDTDCVAGPGRDQDFGVVDQTIVSAPVDAGSGSVLNLGLLPDWRGTYPIPAAPIPSNAVDIAGRITWAGTDTGECTGDDPECAVGDRPQFTLQILNEGTSSVTDPTGTIKVPSGLVVSSIVPSTAPATSPSMKTITFGAVDPKSGFMPFTARGTLPAAAAATFVMTLKVKTDMTTANSRTSRSTTVHVGMSVNAGTADKDGANCSTTACTWGTTDKQVSPDNSNQLDVTIVATASPPVPPNTAPPTTEAPATTVPATTVPATTVPATTAPATTVPPTTAAPTTTVRPTTTTAAPTTTVPATTVPATTVPATTVPATTVPPSTPPTTTPAGNCTVSALLVPSCGAWLGSSTESLDGSYNYSKGMGEYEAVAQNTPDIIHFYQKGATKFPTASDIALSERPGKPRSLLLENWKPSTTLSWKQVADGGADAGIATVASGLKAYNHKLFLTIFHEPENDVQGAGTGYTPGDYVSMYRHVVAQLKLNGVTNVVYVWNAMGYEGWSTIEDSLYPGNDVVDWIAYDPYGEAPHKDMALLLNRSSKASWPGFYSWATAKAPGKPLMLAEWGFSLNTQPNGPAALDGAVPMLQSQFPMLKALVYWNNNNGNGLQVRLDQPTDLGRAYGAAYKRFANNAYFNATETAGAT